MNVPKDKIDPNVDYYGILGLKRTATKEEIKKIYKKLAFKHHPDRNPNDPTAKDRFQKINQAYNILLDDTLRAQIDIKIKAQQHQNERLQKMSAEKRKLREELEAREREALRKKPKTSHFDERAEVERVQKEGYEEIEEIRRKFTEKFKQDAVTMHVIKIKWKAPKELNHKITNEFLQKQFSIFGTIDNIIKKKKSALITFLKKESAIAAASYKWQDAQIEYDIKLLNEDKYKIPVQQKPKIDHKDYESLTMMRLRQAAERQKLKQQLLNQESRENKRSTLFPTG